MRLLKDQPLWTSVILHLFVLFFLVIGSLIQSLKPVKKIHVFEIFEPLTEVSSSNTLTLELKDIPKPIENLLPNQEVESDQIEQLISAEDFFKKNPRREVKLRPISKPEIVPPIINVPEVIQTNAVDRTRIQLSSEEMINLTKYSARIRSKIDAAWIKPMQLTGVNLVAEVLFDVSASGYISKTRLTLSSGNTAFDQSIVKAFKIVGIIGPSPTGKPHQFSLRFRMSD